MTRVTWNAIGERLFEAGVDRGILFPDGKPGVAWNGLVSVSKQPTGGEPAAYYIDGVKYLVRPKKADHTGVIKAYTYPDEFAECEGSVITDYGFSASGQKPKSFNLSYRTFIGDDISGTEHGYKLHLIYNAYATPSAADYATQSNTLAPMVFSWNYTTIPMFAGSELEPTAHIALDSTKIGAGLLQTIENRIYGTDTTEPDMPTIVELIDMFERYPTLKITDNGDGTWTAEGTDYEIIMDSPTEFRITGPTAVPVSADTYTLTTFTD